MGEVPLKCPACDRVTTWTAHFPAREPTVPWEVTRNDALFLLSLRIDPERPLTVER